MSAHALCEGDSHGNVPLSQLAFSSADLDVVMQIHGAYSCFPFH